MNNEDIENDRLKEEKLFGFDSNYEHSAVNNSDSDRIILYIDKYI